MAVAALGLLAALLRRRWGWALLIAGMAGVSLSMRRNIAPAAMLIVPIAAAALTDLFRRPVERLSASARARATTVLAVLVAAASAALSLSVASNDFYYRDRRFTRFGLGMSALKVPVEAAAFVDENITGVVWCDFNSSSNFHFLTRPHRPVPVLTNTWSYPPAVLRESLDYSLDRRPFAQAVADYNVSAVVLRVDAASERLARKLMLDSNWALVHLDGYHAVFVRRDGPDGSLAEQAIDPETFDVAAYKLRLAGLDANRAFALRLGGTTLGRIASAFPPPVEPPAQRKPIAWENAAIDCLRSAIELNAKDDESWTVLGLCLARRGYRRIIASDFAGGERDWSEAQRCFQEAVRLRPGNEAAVQDLAIVKDQLRSLAGGVIKAGKW